MSPAGFEPAIPASERPQTAPTGTGAINPLNAELNPICHLLAVLGGATIVVVSRLRVDVSTVNDRLQLICGKAIMV